MVSHLCKLRLAFLTLISKCIHMPWNQPKLVTAWTFGRTSNYLQNSVIFWLFCLISELLRMLVQHFQVNRQIQGLNSIVFISSCLCCGFDTYLESFSIPLANSVFHGNQKSNKQWTEVWEIWNPVLYMRKKLCLFLLHNYQFENPKTYFSHSVKNLHNNRENSFYLTFWIPFLSIYQRGVSLQILILTKISQLQRECKCLENSVLLLQSTQFGELIIFLLSPLWFSFWQVILLHTETDWSLTMWKWQVLVRHAVGLTSVCSDSFLHTIL